MSVSVRANFLERTLSHLRRVWREPSGERLSRVQLRLKPGLEDGDMAPLLAWMDACLTREGDEVTARTRAVVLGRSYLGLNQQGRIRFLSLLAERYAVDRGAVERCFQHWQQASPAHSIQAAQALRDALDAPRLQLLRQFNALPEGVKFLVDMRAELLDLLPQYPALAALESDLKRLLTSWFDIGLLQLEQINWQSSAELLEKLIAYEAVHAIQGWDDLKNRLDSDRRCFAFFHPNMPHEPLIFVEVALVKGLADNVQTLLDAEAPLLDMQQADTAIFYSISNAQPGLAGISFGNFLIKRVVALLQQEFPTLQRFATLSPLPGFCRWLQAQDAEHLAQLPGGAAWCQLPEPRWGMDCPSQTDRDTALERESESEMAEADTVSLAAKAALLPLVCHYLSQEKGRGCQAKDPVCHFHLSNGAQIAQLNWQADTSAKGMRQSAGIMVNYLYDLSQIEARSQGYSTRGTVALAPALQPLLKH